VTQQLSGRWHKSTGRAYLVRGGSSSTSLNKLFLLDTLFGDEEANALQNAIRGNSVTEILNVD
jgi:hypothetical protein